jgi:hypothetical protein
MSSKDHHLGSDTTVSTATETVSVQTCSTDVPVKSKTASIQTGTSTPMETTSETLEEAPGYVKETMAVCQQDQKGISSELANLEKMDKANLKFAVLIGLIEVGQVTNKEVVNTVLQLVSLFNEIAVQFFFVSLPY